jgi:hypothetical protein
MTPFTPLPSPAVSPLPAGPATATLPLPGTAPGPFLGVAGGRFRTGRERFRTVGVRRSAGADPAASKFKMT